MTDIKAIETKYKGYRFRSRTEARWAVFFDTAGVPWQYELEGFHLPSGRKYLPDFYLPTHKAWLEVKPNAEPGWQGEATYLAGPMFNDSSIDWRCEIKNRNRCGPESSRGHGPLLHGVANNDDMGYVPDPDEVLQRCLMQIRECDLFMAWIPDRERYGTISEIGFAKALNKKIVIAIGKDAVIAHAGAHRVGPIKSIDDAVWIDDDGQKELCPGFQGHELWFIERMADECFFGVDEQEMQELFSCHLTDSEKTCCELSASKGHVYLARGAPGEINNPITYFNHGSPRWRGWPEGFKNIGEAVAAARSARFEHGETPQ
jgi:nucleoside 2-deoxyribosyltransferase